MWPKIVTQHRMENLKEKYPYHDPSYRIQRFSNVQIAPVYFLFLHQKVENLWLSYFCIINAWKFDPLPLCIYTHPFFIKIYSTPSPRHIFTGPVLIFFLHDDRHSSLKISDITGFLRKKPSHSKITKMC